MKRPSIRCTSRELVFQDSSRRSAESLLIGIQQRFLSPVTANAPQRTLTSGLSHSSFHMAFRTASQSRPARKLSNGTSVSLRLHYLHVVAAVGVLLLYACYQVSRSVELRADVHMEKLTKMSASLRTEKPLPVVNAPPQPLDVANQNRSEGPPMTFHRCVNKDHIALTFDDGPNILTLALLELFKKHDVKATFFFVGINLELDETNRYATKRTFDEGHQVASHLWSHPRMSGLTEQRIREQLQQNADALAKITGHRPRYMRPPYGSTNEMVRETICQEAYKSVMWSCDSSDWKFTKEADVTTQIKRCSLDGLVLLLHEGRQSTVEAVEKFIVRVRATHPEKKFVRADECSGFPGDAYGR